MKKRVNKQTGRGREKKPLTNNNGCVTIDPKCREIALALDSFSKGNLVSYFHFQEVLTAQLPEIENITAHKSTKGLRPKDLGAYQQGLIKVIPLQELQDLSLQKGGLVIKRTK
jgi:hypothetical protein